MIKSVFFISKAVAEQITNPEKTSAIISIVEPNETRNLSPDWVNKLELDFHDTDATANNGETWSLLKVENEQYTKFNKTMAIQVIDFINKLHKQKDRINLAVHCHAGISRSASVAKFVAEVYELPFNHNYSLYNKFVFSVLRQAYYHDGYN